MSIKLFASNIYNYVLNSDFKSKNPMYYKIFHPLSGQCVQFSDKGVFASSCENSSRWDQHQDGGAIKLAGSPRCLGPVVGDGAAASVSGDCSSNGSMWKFVSSSGLHLAAQAGEGKYLCLEKNASDSQIVTKKCLCVGDDLADVPTCADNPQSQWFKLVPANV